MSSPLQADPELAAALGRATGAWAALESMLTMLFSIMTRIDLAMSVALFDFFKSTRTQKDVLMRMAKMSAHVTPDQLETLSDLMKDYLTLAGRRNEVAHNPYGWTDKEQTQVYLMLKIKASREADGFPYATRVVSKTELDRLTDDIDFFRFRLLALYSGIAGLPPLPNTPP